MPTIEALNAMSVQEFTTAPDDDTRKLLADAIDAQESGVVRLNSLLPIDDQREKISAVSALAASMRTQAGLQKMQLPFRSAS